MSGINPGFSTGNMLDAGASSATKNTDLSEGIFEDVSSDIKSKEQGSVLASGVQGGMLDRVAGSSGSLGYDAQHQSRLSKVGGSTETSNSTDLTGGMYENARQETQGAADTVGQYLQSAKATANRYTESGQDTTSDIGASAQNSTENATNTGGGLLDTVRDKVSGVFHGHSNGPTQQNSELDAGASSATKSTDLSEGIHEDAGRGIESIRGATARRN